MGEPPLVLGIDVAGPGPVDSPIVLRDHAGRKQELVWQATQWPNAKFARSCSMAGPDVDILETIAGVSASWP